MTTVPPPGSVWQQRKPHGVTPAWLSSHRRIVDVTQADESYVHGVGRWQERKGDGWADLTWGRRKTRVRTNLFVQRYDPDGGRPMIQQPAINGTYYRRSDDQIITVLGCTGSNPTADVSYRLGATGKGKRFHVQLGNFWKKYTEWPEG